MTTKLTESAAEALAPGAILRDHRFKGLMALGRKGATTWAYQTDLRRNGRFVRTVRVTLGKQGEMTLKEARAAAAKVLEQIRAGIDPNAEAREAKELTMLAVLEDYIKERADCDRPLAERTVWDYRRHWMNKSLNTLYPMRNMHPRDITRDDVRALKARLMKRGGTMCRGSRPRRRRSRPPRLRAGTSPRFPPFSLLARFRRGERYGSCEES